MKFVVVFLVSILGFLGCGRKAPEIELRGDVVVFFSGDWSGPYFCALNGETYLVGEVLTPLLREGKPLKCRVEHHAR